MTESRAHFGTFAGVFRPISLTILGAMLYLREGWLVGNAGLAGALFVILLATAITGATALSLASIATNVCVRPGGAFAIVSQALGLEAGGAIGVPLYIAQTLSSALYV
jgi:amino acid transporter